MACRLFNAKPISEPMLPYCQLDPNVYISIKKHLIFKSFYSVKCTWKYRLRNGGHVPRWWWVNYLLCVVLHYIILCCTVQYDTPSNTWYEFVSDTAYVDCIPVSLALRYKIILQTCKPKRHRSHAALSRGCYKRCNVPDIIIMTSQWNELLLFRGIRTDLIRNNQQHHSNAKSRRSYRRQIKYTTMRVVSMRFPVYLSKLIEHNVSTGTVLGEFNKCLLSRP